METRPISSLKPTAGSSLRDRVSLAALLIAMAAVWMAVGGGLYEKLVVNPHWPTNPDLIRPDQGGIDRKYFWLPSHTLFEIALIASLCLWWKRKPIRFALVVALASHLVMRGWSFSYFIPQAIEFEAGRLTDPEAARRWVWWSLWRTPLDLLTATAVTWANFRAWRHRGSSESET